MGVKKVLIWIFLLVLVQLFACAPTENNEDGRLRIVTTTGIIADAAREIVGDSAIVESLMGPGVDPHLYKVSQNDLSKLTRADIIFYNGLHLEGKMGEVLENLESRKKVIPVSRGIAESKLRKVNDFAGGFDPHIWFDIAIWQQAVEYMSDQIQNLDPENKEYYRLNTTNYLNQLKELDSWTKQEIATIPERNRVLITAHDAFGYFGDAYDIEVEGLQGISTVSEPGLKNITEITDLIVEREIKAIFVESSVPQKLVKSVVEGARQKGQPVKIGGTLYSDALGAEESPAGNYAGMVKENVNTIVSSLK